MATRPKRIFNVDKSSVIHRSTRIMHMHRDDRAVLAVAIPAFAALVAEPLMLLADTAIVGHLGTEPLAGLAIASTVLTTLVGLCIFLAYGSTATVSRRYGAGDQVGALTNGFHGVWLALQLGVLLMVVLWLAAPWVSGALASSLGVAEQSVTYLRMAAPAVPAMLTVLAATGALRGILDLRTPLTVMIAANALNVVVSLILVYGVDMGLRGAALGTTIAQWCAAGWLVRVLLSHARADGASLRPRWVGILRAALDGAPLFARTVTLRAALLLATGVAATFGDAPLAAHQIVTTLVSLLTFMLDALAIAGQTLTGNALGSGDADRTRALVNRMIGWGIGSGVILGVALAAGYRLIPALFTSDSDVTGATAGALLVAAAIQPVSGIVFVLDGVLIGAGDGVYLAWAGLAVLIVYTPLALSAALGNLVWLWLAYGAFMIARLLTLYFRQRGTAWMVLGAPPAD